MSETPSVQGKSSQHSFSPAESLKKAPWVDIALIVGIVGLATVALLAHGGFIHLPHIGVVSPKYIEYALAGVTGGLFVIEMSRLAYKCIQSAKHDKPTFHATMESLPQETESMEFKMPVTFMKEESETYFHAQIDEANDARALFYGQDSTTKRTSHVSEYTFEIDKKSATLYGVYPTGVNTQEIEKDISLKLNLTKPKTHEALKKALNSYAEEKGISVAVKYEGKVIVSATHYLYVPSEVGKIDGQRGERRAEVYPIPGDGNHLLILGNAETINGLSDESSLEELAQISAKNQHTHQHSLDLMRRARDKGVKEVGFITLNLGKQYTVEDRIKLSQPRQEDY